MADDIRERMLKAAGPIFAEKGFEGATVREICSAAGVNVAAVNYYFRDKERLYIETVKSAHVRTVAQAPLPDWPAEATASDRLRGFIGVLLERMIGVKPSPWQSRLLMREILHPTAACAELVQDHFRPQLELLEQIVRELASGELPPHRMHQFLFSIIGQCLYYRVAGEVVGLLVSEEERRDHFGIEKIADHITEVVLAALGQCEVFYQHGGDIKNQNHPPQPTSDPS